MIKDLPLYITIIFILTTFLTIALIYKAANSKMVLWLLSGWAILQGSISLTLFYTDTAGIPPRFILLVAPPLLLVLFLFFTVAGRRAIDNLDARILTYLHTIRVPVELVLFWLFQQGVVPQLMTFEGGNFDIFSGLTAPLIAYFGYTRKSISRPILLIWNFICLGLLLNIVVHAILSAPTPFQQMAFDQPNVAVLHFPFVWLPCCIVPVVLFSHLALIRQLIRNKPL